MNRRLMLDGVESRTFDMRCFRVMAAAGKDAAYEYDVALAGVCDLFERDEADIYNLPTDTTFPLYTKIIDWMQDAIKSFNQKSGGGKLLKGDQMTMLYANLLRSHGILPDEIDRQDPAWFFAVVTEEHLSEDDIPAEMGMYYGL